MKFEYTWVSIRSEDVERLAQIHNMLNRYDVFYSLESGLHNMGRKEDLALCFTDVLNYKDSELDFFYGNKAGNYSFLESLDEEFTDIEWIVLREGEGVAVMSSHAQHRFDIKHEILTGEMKPIGDLSMIKYYVSLPEDTLLFD